MPSTDAVKPDLCNGCAVHHNSYPSEKDVPCWSCGMSCASTTSAAPAAIPQAPVYHVNMHPLPYRPRYFSHTYVHHQPYHQYPYPYPIHPHTAYYVPYAPPPPPIPVIYTPPPPPPPTPPVSSPPTLKPGPIVPLVQRPPGTTPIPTPVAYQSLQLLLEDLNHLLHTPHEEQPFYFRGTCAIIADPAVGHAKKLSSVAEQVVERTALIFDPQTLEIQSSEQAASTSTSTHAVWMPVGAGRPTTTGVSCTHCRHTLTIDVERCHGPLIRGSDISGYQGQRILVDLRHSVE
ncbi:hypothetical protein FB45DRAFT_1064175 [Roridomyces roridus]|uniref:Uncharacterized protein n=1 Tax=Roridomyces roridus TaxID=1738132 RepID=A0AAD7BBF2_9AGAR|nr:hypothetical protein FB45DRAFT_1064175 [Roridomyces roridus]